MSNKPYASSCEVKSIALYKANDDSKPYVNLINMVSGFQYHEDITAPAYSATMIVVDNAENLISSMPIQGFERVIFTVEAFDIEYVYYFRVARIINRSNKDRQNIYTLYLLSEEALVNEGVRVNNVLTGTPTEITRNLLQQYLNVSPSLLGDSNLDKSEGRIKLLPAKKSPFSIIRSLQTKTVSKTKPKPITKKGEAPESSGPSAIPRSDINIKQQSKGTAGFLFYRTYRGFAFKSIDALCEQTPVGEPFKYLPGKTTYESAFKIQEIEYQSELNMMKSLREGVYSSVVCFFDINTGKYQEYVYSLKNTWDDMVHLGSKSKLPAGMERLTNYPSRVMSTIVNNECWYSGSDLASEKSEYIDTQKEYLSQGISRLGIMSNQVLTISLTGHLELTVGNLINIRVPNQVPDRDRDKETWDPENSGTYLVSKLNHQFDISGGTVFTVLQLIRDSYGIRDDEN